VQPDGLPIPNQSEPLAIYTIGHSNHATGELLGLLRGYAIELLVDVRSSPYSRHAPQANRESLAVALAQAGIVYRWMGERLGGKPQGVVADYDVLRSSPAFRDGIRELVLEAAQHRIAIMCAEGDHRQCHRYKLITPALLDLNICVLHIQPGGSLADEESAPTVGRTSLARALKELPTSPVSEDRFRLFGSLAAMTAKDIGIVIDQLEEDGLLERFERGQFRPLRITESGLHRLKTSAGSNLANRSSVSLAAQPLGPDPLER